MGGVAIGMDERHCDGIDPHVAEIARRRAHRLFIQRHQFIAAKIESSWRLADQFERHHARRLQPPGDVAEVTRHRLAADLQHFTITARDDESETRVAGL